MSSAQLLIDYDYGQEHFEVDGPLNFYFTGIDGQLAAHPHRRRDEPTDRTRERDPFHHVKTDGASEIQQARNEHKGESEQGNEFSNVIHDGLLFLLCSIN